MSTPVRSVESLVAGRPARDSEIVIVAPICEAFADFVAAGRRGEVGLHFCVDGRSALRMSRRFRADVWLVAASLPDISGIDLLEMLLPSVARAEVDPALGAAGASPDRIGAGLRAAIFVVADAYSFEDEQRVLRAGAAGYLAVPLSLDLVRSCRNRGGVGANAAASSRGVSLSGRAR